MARVYQRKDRPGYTLEWRDMDGRRRYRKCSDRREAERQLRLIEAELDRQQLDQKLGIERDTRTNALDVQPLYEAYMKFQVREHKKGTCRRARTALDNFLNRAKPREVRDITPAMMEDYRSARTRERKPAKKRVALTSARTADLEVQTVKAWLTWAEREKRIKENPIKDVKANTGGKNTLRLKTKEETRALEDDEIPRLLRVSSKRLRWVWTTLLGTGLRKDELVYLQWKHVDLMKGLIRIAGEIAKTDSSVRSIPMAPEVRQVIEDILAEQDPTPSGYVFLNGRGMPWRNNLLREFYRCARLAGIDSERINIHALRATFATILDSRGVRLKTIQCLLGHASLSTTMRYIKTRRDDVADAVEGLMLMPDQEGNKPKTATQLLPLRSKRV